MFSAAFFDVLLLIPLCLFPFHVVVETDTRPKEALQLVCFAFHFFDLN